MRRSVAQLLIERLDRFEEESSPADDAGLNAPYTSKRPEGQELKSVPLQPVQSTREKDANSVPFRMKDAMQNPRR